MKRSFLTSIALLIALTNGGVWAQGTYQYPAQGAVGPTPVPTPMPSPTATRSTNIPGFTPFPSTTRRHLGRHKRAQVVLTPTPFPVRSGATGGVYRGTFNPKK